MNNQLSSSASSSLLTRGTLINGAVSISLDDSWTGRSLLEVLNRTGSYDVRHKLRRTS